MRRLMLLAALFSLVLIVPGVASGGIVAKINISSQRMDVFVDGAPRYNWAVSTARSPYRTPTGTFRPTAVVRYHASTLYSGSPMPYSIFFRALFAGEAIRRRQHAYPDRLLAPPPASRCLVLALELARALARRGNRDQAYAKGKRKRSQTLHIVLEEMHSRSPD